MFPVLYTRFDEACNASGCATSRPKSATGDIVEDDDDCRAFTKTSYYALPRHKCDHYDRLLLQLKNPLAPDMALPNSLYRGLHGLMFKDNMTTMRLNKSEEEELMERLRILRYREKQRRWLEEQQALADAAAAAASPEPEPIDDDDPPWVKAKKRADAMPDAEPAVVTSSLTAEQLLFLMSQLTAPKEDAKSETSTNKKTPLRTPLRSPSPMAAIDWDALDVKSLDTTSRKTYSLAESFKTDISSRASTVSRASKPKKAVSPSPPAEELPAPVDKPSPKQSPRLPKKTKNKSQEPKEEEPPKPSPRKFVVVPARSAPKKRPPVKSQPIRWAGLYHGQAGESVLRFMKHKIKQQRTKQEAARPKKSVTFVEGHEVADYDTEDSDDGEVFNAIEQVETAVEEIVIEDDDRADEEDDDDDDADFLDDAMFDASVEQIIGVPSRSYTNAEMMGKARRRARKIAVAVLSAGKNRRIKSGKPRVEPSPSPELDGDDELPELYEESSPQRDGSALDMYKRAASSKMSSERELPSNLADDEAMSRMSTPMVTTSAIDRLRHKFSAAFDANAPPNSRGTSRVSDILVDGRQSRLWSKDFPLNQEITNSPQRIFKRGATAISVDRPRFIGGGGGSACTSMGHFLTGTRSAIQSACTKMVNGQIVREKMPSLTEQLLLYYKSVEERRSNSALDQVLLGSA